jgi:hypothetical protein
MFGLQFIGQFTAHAPTECLPAFALAEPHTRWAKNVWTIKAKSRTKTSASLRMFLVFIDQLA